MTSTVGQLTVGPDRHGVVEYARTVHAALQSLDAARYPAVDVGAGNLGVDGVHVHFTDRLFGATAEDAAEAFRGLADRVGVGVSVTLHDLPQPSDGRHAGARVEAYRRVVDIARGVIVSSDHERALLSEITDATATVVPLAVTLPPSGAPRPEVTDDVAILGFLYPGKGHEEVLRALAAVDPSVGLLAVGMPSEGHDDLAVDLAAVAAGLGRRFRVTGYVDQHDLPALLRTVAVPIAHHRHMSASGSITTWIAAGRRPLAPRTRYTTEIADRSPGTIVLYDDTPDGLVEALNTALVQPHSTWLDSTARAYPSWSQVAAAYADAFDTWFA